MFFCFCFCCLAEFIFMFWFRLIPEGQDEKSYSVAELAVQTGGPCYWADLVYVHTILFPHFILFICITSHQLIFRGN